MATLEDIQGMLAKINKKKGVKKIMDKGTVKSGKWAIFLSVKKATDQKDAAYV